MRLEHKEFCARIRARKEKKLEQRRAKRRVALACIPFLLCFGVLAYAGLSSGPLANPNPETVGGTEEGSIDLLYEFLSDPKGGSVSFLSANEVSMELTEDKELAALLSFAQENRDAFSLFSLQGNTVSTEAAEDVEKATELKSAVDEAIETDCAPGFAESAEGTLDYAPDETQTEPMELAPEHATECKSECSTYAASEEETKEQLPGTPWEAETESELASLETEELLETRQAESECATEPAIEQDAPHDTANTKEDETVETEIDLSVNTGKFPQGQETLSAAELESSEKNVSNSEKELPAPGLYLIQLRDKDGAVIATYLLSAKDYAALTKLLEAAGN